MQNFDEKEGNGGGLRANVRKYSKTFENLQKLYGNVRKLYRNIQKLMQNIQEYLNVLVRCPLFIVHREISHRLPKLTAPMTEKIENQKYISICIHTNILI